MKNLVSVFKNAEASDSLSKNEIYLAPYPNIFHFMENKLHQILDPDDAIHQMILRNWRWQEQSTGSPDAKYFSGMKKYCGRAQAYGDKSAWSSTNLFSVLFLSQIICYGLSNHIHLAEGSSLDQSLATGLGIS